MSDDRGVETPEISIPGISAPAEAPESTAVEPTATEATATDSIERTATDSIEPPETRAIEPEAPDFQWIEPRAGLLSIRRKLHRGTQILALSAASLFCVGFVASADIPPDDPAWGHQPASIAALSPSATEVPTRFPPTPSPTPTPYGGPTLGPDAGSVFFDDDFFDLSHGWPIGTVTANTRFEFWPGSYVIHASGAGVDHLIAAPYKVGFSWLAMTVTGSLVATHATAGLGVTCHRGVDADQVTYEFVVYDRGGWVLERRDGPPSMGALPVILAQGNSAAVLGPDPISVVGVCDSTENGQQTTLAFYANGARLAVYTDSTGSQPGGWFGGIVAVSGDTPITLVIAHFQERRQV